MQLAELWPYALILVSGSALMVTVVLLLVQPRDAPQRIAPHRSGRRNGAGQERPDKALHKSADDRHATVRAARAADGRPVVGAHIGAETVVTPTRASTNPPDAPLVRQRAVPLIPPEPIRTVATGDFVSAAQGAEPGAPSQGGSFEIPSFLRRSVDRAGIESAVGSPPPVDEPEPRILRRGIGRLFYDPPAAMRALDSQIVTIRILRDPDDARPAPPAFAGLRGFASPGPEEGTVGVSMTLQMTGADALHIEPRSPSLQVLDPRHNAAEWTFKLTPLRPGLHRLELTIAASRAVGGQIEVEEPEVVLVKIQVRANGRHLAGRALQIAAIAIAVALLTWLVAACSTVPG